MKHELIIVSGRVQGVGFRWSVYQFAITHQICGTVRNCANGTVQIDAQTTPEIMAKLIAFIQQGPTPYAQVDRLQTRSLTIDHSYHDFMIS